MITEQTTQSIQTIDELITALTEGDKSNFGSLLRKMDLSLDQFKPYESWVPDSYTRNCIVENESFELILICWAEQQMTPIHDHGGEECWVYFLDGQFEELIYELDEDENLVLARTNKADSGYISYMIDFMGVHRLRNCSDNRGMSLHLYAKPIRSCHVFDAETSEISSKQLKYCTKA